MGRLPGSIRIAHYLQLFKKKIFFPLFSSRRYQEENDNVVDSTVDSTTAAAGYFMVPSPPLPRGNEAAHEGGGHNSDDEEEGADTESIPGKLGKVPSGWIFLILDPQKNSSQDSIERISPDFLKLSLLVSFVEFATLEFQTY